MSLRKYAISLQNAYSFTKEVKCINTDNDCVLIQSTKCDKITEKNEF
jgi:uncharacterized protein YbcV (DUF1398 family)